MVAVLRFVAGAWTFFWRQPALLRSTFLLIFLPMLVMNYLELPFEAEQPQQIAVLVVLHVAAIVVLTWGVACTLTVGKRLLQAKAGRLRTSFTAVQAQARGLIIPLLLTDILRACITLLWALPFCALAFYTLVITGEQNLTSAALIQNYPWIYPLGAFLALPPLLFLLRTVLAPMVVVYERISFRPALARSAALTKGRFWWTIAVVVLLALLWAPSFAVEAILRAVRDDAVILYVIPAITAFLDTFALVLWLLSITLYYKALGGRVRQAHPDNAEND